MDFVSQIPPVATAQRWAWDYIFASELSGKTDPETPPLAWEEDAPVRRELRPTRPAGLQLVTRAPKSPGKDALRRPERRAELLHTFWHHELQAAELMCWAVLAFPDTPEAFRRGLIRIALDEIRHMEIYANHMEKLGFSVGDFPVRDWFWERVPACETPAQFCAVMGMGLEGGNLDHTTRFTDKFRAVGDEEGAQIQQTIAREEIPHVRFGIHWFYHWVPEANFADWEHSLPAPLSPMLMKGKPFNIKDRQKAGFNELFLQELEQWKPADFGSLISMQIWKWRAELGIRLLTGYLLGWNKHINPCSRFYVRKTGGCRWSKPTSLFTTRLRLSGWLFVHRPVRFAHCRQPELACQRIRIGRPFVV
jgi:uncharacterized ferritin-like protein (DUF455 family)